MFDRNRRRRWALILASSIATVALTGCGGNAESIVNNAISSIQAQPGQWQQVMTDTMAKLQTVDTNTFNQVSNLYNSAVGQAQNFTYCSVDFFGARVTEGLQGILHQLNSKKPAPTQTPVVCNTNPSSSITAGTTQLVTYYGYNFNVYSSQSSFHTSLQYANGQVVDAGFGHISTVSPYEVVVEFQAADLSKLDRTQGPKLALEWGTGPVAGYGNASSSLPIIIPEPPKPVLGYEDFIVSVHANSGAFSGDCATINQTYTIASSQSGNAQIDRSKGDSGHPGISEIEVHDNQQSKNTLRGYNYRPTSNTAAQVTGTVCGAGGWGPGAIFERKYRVYTIDRG